MSELVSKESTKTQNSNEHSETGYIDFKPKYMSAVNAFIPNRFRSRC